MKMVIQFGLFGGGRNDMKKTTYVIILLTLMTAIFSGCANWELVNSEKIAKQNCEDILKYLDNSDKEELKNMFCNKVLSTEDLDKQIEDAIDFFQGKTSSWSGEMRWRIKLV